MYVSLDNNNCYAFDFSLQCKWLPYNYVSSGWFSGKTIQANISEWENCNEQRIKFCLIRQSYPMLTEDDTSLYCSTQGGRLKRISLRYSDDSCTIKEQLLKFLGPKGKLYVTVPFGLFKHVGEKGSV